MSTLERAALVRDHLTGPRTQDSSQWRLSHPIHAERPMRVLCVGAGASGLCFAYKLQRSFEKFDLQIYEKNQATSGTWFENVYPGCACDVPAHNYTFSWEPKLDWSAVYAGSAEIKKYFQDFAEKYDLNKFIKLNHKVVGAYWNDASAQWDVQVEDLVAKDTFSTSCDILINASGILNAWQWPAIPGIGNYKGKLLHSANWDHSVPLEGKQVGLIGNGSSGIQILPSIQPRVGKLTTFIREPTWVSPIQGLEQHVYSQEELDEFKKKPGALLSYRKQNETNLDTITNIFARDGIAQKETRAIMTQQMKDKLKNDKLASQLIPEWGVGCRRLTPGVNYLETLSAPNVTVVYGEINQITEKGCICDDGREYPVDVLICATGFNTSFKPRFPVVGLRGVDLRDQWTSEPKGYLGVAASNMPNYFQFLGPNCPVGNGPLLSAIEYQADYMLKFCDRWQTENIHSFSPKQEAVDDFTALTHEWMKGTVWTEDCRSWYRGGSTTGRITALWPGSSLHYIECVSNVRYDDWHIKYTGNRFNFLGNGRSQVEEDFSADWAWYVREHDDSPLLSKSKARKLLTSSGSKDVHDQARQSVGGNLIGKTV